MTAEWRRSSGDGRVTKTVFERDRFSMMGSMVERLNEIADKAEKEYEGRYPPLTAGWARAWLLKLGTGHIERDHTYVSYELKAIIEKFINDAIRERMDANGETHGQCDKEIATNGKFVFSSEMIPYGQFDNWVKKVASLSGQPVDWTPGVVSSDKHKLSIQLTVRTTGDTLKVFDAIDALLPEHDDLYMDSSGAVLAGAVLDKNSPSRRFARFRVTHTLEQATAKVKQLEKSLSDERVKFGRLDNEAAHMRQRIEYLNDEIAKGGRYERAIKQAANHLREAVASVMSVMPWRGDDDDND